MARRSLFCFLFSSMIFGGVSLSAPAAEDATIKVNAAKPGIHISDQMWGLFFEDINFAGDGGIYAELVRQRDFEGQDPLEGWSLEQQGATGKMQLDRQNRLNKVRRQSLRIEVSQVEGGTVRLVNQGFWGIPVRSGEKYSFSLFVKGNPQFAGQKLSVQLQNKSLDQTYAQLELGPVTGEWQKLTGSLIPSGNDNDGRLVLSAGAAGQFWVDMVSLFPATYNDEPNGMRADLVQLLADLKPSFFRFPGGCFVEGQTLEDAFKFKETIGPIEQRKGRRNFWNYNNTDGLGYYEYLRLAEDLDADPIFCINPGGNNGVSERIPLDELDAWLDTAVHAVEFALGPPTNEWGAKRAAMGHPEPFKCETFYLQIGNETEFGYQDYFARFNKYREHVKAAYPGENVKIIADSWGLAHRQSVDTHAIDFHQYMSWGRAIADRDLYDDAPRGAPYVFKGEYATRSSSGILQGLSEAVYMMGLEENGDEVVLAAYAPLFGNVNQCQWHPNLIYFDNHRVMGTISYYVQQMFSQHRGDRQLEISVEQQPAKKAEAETRMAGSVGFATWGTEAEFDDLRVESDGKTVYDNDFSDAASIDEWTSNGNGEWTVDDGVLRQSKQISDARFWLPGKQWSNYTVRFKARKRAGAEGFMGMVHVNNAMDWAWANFAGWGNTQHAFERADGGAKMMGARHQGSVETDRWYDVEIEVDSSKVVAKLDGETLLTDDLADVDEEPEFDIYASAVTDEAKEEIVLRLVNIAETAKTIKLQVEGCELSGHATAITLAAENREASQSLDDPLRYSPQTKKLSGIKADFDYELPPCSFTILRLEK